MKKIFAPLLLAFVLVSPLAAQRPASGEQLPPDAAHELVLFYNSGAALRMAGASVIARGSDISGGIAVLGGPVRVEGKVGGTLAVINGNVTLTPGAEIDGDLIVTGGEVHGLDDARIRGGVIIYRGILRYRVVSDGEIALAPTESWTEFAASREFGFGRTDLTLATRRGYNRVEGLPIVVGPRFESHGLTPLRLEFLAIYRTISGLDIQPRRLGYLGLVEKVLPGRLFTLGLTLGSEIVPIETVGLSDRENSLSSFVLHRDYRDHYQREGWGAHLRFEPHSRSFELELEYREEEHESVRARDPWTLFRGSDEWRPQPVIAEGKFRSLSLRGQIDTRNELSDPTTGWYLEWWVERGLGGSLEVPLPDEPVATGGPVGADRAFALGSLDLRRYARLGPSSRLAVRVTTTSSLNDRPLPAQRQRTLGGSGSLPGYSSFEFDCGARDLIGRYDATPFYTYYGCDRVALFQIEYRADFPFSSGWGRKLGRDIDLGERFGWAVFFDAGRAWTEREATRGRGTGMNDFAADLGLGLRLGPIGLYWAMPLSGNDRNLRFSLRLGPRL